MNQCKLCSMDGAKYFMRLECMPFIKHCNLGRLGLMLGFGRSSILINASFNPTTWHKNHSRGSRSQHSITGHQKFLIQLRRRKFFVVLLNRMKYIGGFPRLVQGKKHIPFLAHITAFNVLDTQASKKTTIVCRRRAGKDKSESNALAHVDI